MWFTDTRVAITTKGGEGYNEYLRHLFKAYLTSNSIDFPEAVKYMNECVRFYVKY